MRHTLVFAGLVVLMAVSALAQTTQPASSPEPSDWLHQKKMTGDWGGARTAMEQKGIVFKLDVTQAIQNNAHGGADTTNAFRYTGSTTMELTLDTGKMGLWPGGQFVFLADTKWGGYGIQPKVGALLPVNLDNYFPGSDDGGIMTLSEFFYQQVLFDGKLILLGGKLFGARAFDTNEFANKEQEQFMNLAFRNVPMIGSFLPYTTMGVGAIVNPTEWWSVLTAVTDTDGDATRTGFDTAFHGDTNTSVIHEWDFTIKPFGQVGHQRVGFVWSCENMQYLTPISPFKDLGPTLMKIVGKKLFNMMTPLLPFSSSDDNLMVFYNFDQYLYTKADDPTQGFGLFGRFGWARDDVNPIESFYSIGAGGKGLIPTRAKDQYGVAYYLCDLSDRLRPVAVQESGIECYYNFEIFPWLHLTPDLQIIMMPGGSGENDVSLCWGLRLQMNL